MISVSNLQPDENQAAKESKQIPRVVIAIEIGFDCYEIDVSPLQDDIINNISQLIADAIRIDSEVDFDLFLVENPSLLEVKDQITEIWQMYHPTHNPTSTQKENIMNANETNTAATSTPTAAEMLAAELAAAKAKIAEMEKAAAEKAGAEKAAAKTEESKKTPLWKKATIAAAAVGAVGAGGFFAWKKFHNQTAG